MNEVEAVSERMSSLTKSPFKVEAPERNNPLYDSKNLRWFVICPYVEYHNQTAHAQVVWEDNQDNLWLESSILGFVSDWIKRDYGEEAVVKFMNMESHDFSNPQFRQRLAKKFPATMSRFSRYNSIASEVSSRRHVQLRMRYDSSDKVAMITMGAKIEIKGMDLQSKLKAIETNVRALKETYQEITDL